MDPDLRERREETFELLIVEGYPYSTVVEKIAEDYDMTEGGVKADISRMSDWLPKIVEDQDVRKDGLVRLRELRANRQRLHRMARATGDVQEELKIRRHIDDNLDLDFALSQSLGETDRRPAQIEQKIEETQRFEMDDATREVALEAIRNRQEQEAGDADREIWIVDEEAGVEAEIGPPPEE